MSAIFNAVKATSLPASPAVHTLYYIKSGSDVRVKGYVTDATGTAFPLGIIDEQDVLGVMLDGFTVGTNAPINSSNTIFTSFRNIQAQLNTLSTAVAGGIKIPLPIDCSTNPNYPAAAAGDSYLVTVGGRIGGASGELVQAGDKIIAQQTNAGGNQATVGTAWYIINGNIDIATTEIAGVTRIATSVEVDAGTDNFAYVTPTTLRGGVRNTTLTGYAVGANTAISATDSVLGAFGKVQGQLNNKETSFTKNTGFNKNFGSIAGTVAQGNDTRFHNPVTLGTANGLSLVAQALSLALASTSVTGALSNTDWNTFNSKQNALTDPVTGSGSAGQVSFWTGAGVQSGDSGLVWDSVDKILTVKSNSSPKILLDINTPDDVTRAKIDFKGVRSSVGISASIQASRRGLLEFYTQDLPSITDPILRWSILSNGILQSNGAQTIQTSGTEALTLQGNGGNTILNPSGGNVGIGTSAPLTNLHVRGQGGNQGVILTLSNGGEITGINNPVGLINFYSDDSSENASGIKGSLGVYNEFSLLWDGSVLRHQTYMSFATSRDSVSSEKWRITSTGIFQSNGAQTIQTSGTEALTLQGNGGNTILNPSGGNVGIGTSSPNALLEISGNAGADPGPVANPTTFRITDAGSAATGAGDTTNPWGRVQFYSEDTSSGGPSVHAQIASIYADRFSSASHLVFYTQANLNIGIIERMRITAAGNVGIGVNSPSEKLHVAGKILVGTRTEAAGKFATFSTAGVLQEQTVAQVRATVMTWTEAQW